MKPSVKTSETPLMALLKMKPSVKTSETQRRLSPWKRGLGDPLGDAGHGSCADDGVRADGADEALAGDLVARALAAAPDGGETQPSLSCRLLEGL